MAEERIKLLELKQEKIDQKHKGVERWIWKAVSAIGMGLVVWYLNGINSSLKMLSDDIVQIKLTDSANSVRLSRLEADVNTLKSNEKELSKRIGHLERR